MLCMKLLKKYYASFGSEFLLPIFVVYPPQFVTKDLLMHLVLQLPLDVGANSY